MLTNLKLTPLSRACALGFEGRRKTRAQQHQQQQAHPRALCLGRSQVRGVRKNRPSSANLRRARDLTFRYLRSLGIVRRLAQQRRAASSNVTRMYALRSGAPNELRNGSYKHGSFTWEAIAKRQTTPDFIQTVRALRSRG